MISLEDYFGRVTHIAAPPDEIKANALDLLTRVNGLLGEVALRRPDLSAATAPEVNSGWRPALYNAKIPGAAVNSKHITGQAIDLADPDGELDEFLFANPEYLAEAGLYLEHPLATKNWCHLQSVPPRSGRLIFFP